MRRILILTLICLIFGNAFTAPASYESKAFIENYKYNREENGNYDYSFKTSNGIRRFEYGNIRNTGTQEYLTVRGQFSYIDPDGKFVTVRYYADDTGFHVLPDQLELPATQVPPTMSISGILGPHVIASLLGARR